MSVKDTRERLVEATERLLRTRGLARLSTRDIAREAGVADGALYHHFSDKRELVMEVIKGNAPSLLESLQGLPLRVGQRTVRENLTEVAEAMFDFHQRVAPLICSLFADDALLAKSRETTTDPRAGPEGTIAAIVAYVAAEQRIGRVTGDVEPEAIASLFLGASFQVAVMDHLLARKLSSTAARKRAHSVVAALVTGLEPRVSPRGTR